MSLPEITKFENVKQDYYELLLGKIRFNPEFYYEIEKRIKDPNNPLSKIEKKVLKQIPIKLGQLFPNIGIKHYWITQEMFDSHEEKKRIRNSKGKNLYNLTKKLYQTTCNLKIEEIRKVYLLSTLLDNDATILSKQKSKSAKINRDIQYLDDFISNANLDDIEQKMLNLYFSGLSNEEIASNMNEYKESYIKDKMQIIKKKILISGISKQKDNFENITYEEYLKNPELESNQRYLRYSLRKEMDSLKNGLEIDDFYKTFNYKIIRGIKKEDLFLFVYEHSPGK